MMAEPVPPARIYEPESPDPAASGPLLVPKPTVRDASGAREPAWAEAEAEKSKAEKLSEQIRRLPDRAEAMKERVTSAFRSGGETRVDLDKLVYRARRRLRELQTQARAYSHRDPVGAVVVAGIAGVVLGFALRLWRDHRD